MKGEKIAKWPGWDQCPSLEQSQGPRGGPGCATDVHSSIANSIGTVRHGSGRAVVL